MPQGTEGRRGLGRRRSGLTPAANQPGSEIAGRAPGLLACIWGVFLIRGVFYVSSVPLWEGFDEWAHYATLQNIATGGGALIKVTDPVSREVQASLELAPAPWLVNGLKQDDYWR